MKHIHYHREYQKAGYYLIADVKFDYRIILIFAQFLMF